MDFTFITANDIHISDNGPRSRIDDFRSTVLGKLEQMRMACKKLNVDAALIAGDLYNLKAPYKNSHGLNKSLIDIFQRFSCPIYMVEGNHDLTANNLDSLEAQPLGVLFADKTLIQLRHEVIQKKGVKISLVGVPYTENLDLSKLQIPPKEDCATQICLMHLYAGLKSGMLFKERLYGYDELAKLSPDIFVLGHYHIDQGIYTQDGKSFINIGSFTRGTLSEDDINHHPQIGLIKITVEDGKPQYQINSIKLKIKPAEEVFDLEKKKIELKENEEIKKFIDKLVSESVESEEGDKDILKIVDGMDLVDELRKRVLFYLEKAA